MPFKMLISAFPEGGTIPRLHTCDGADVSPALEWSGEPSNTNSFALIVDDPDAPSGVWNHWLFYDIPSSVHELAQGFKIGKFGQSGINDFGKTGYNGPCPPKGHGPHRYFFKLFAVDTAALKMSAGPTRAQLDTALQGHVLGQTEYMGRYERQ